MVHLQLEKFTSVFPYYTIMAIPPIDQLESYSTIVLQLGSPTIGPMSKHATVVSKEDAIKKKKVKIGGLYSL